ncbi:MAG: hypothetical protein ACREQZ_14440 [Woeseiaceae bacterium]
MMARTIRLVGPLAAAWLVAGCAEAPPPVGPPAPPALAGAWRSSVQFQNGAFAPIKDLEFMYVFNIGGTMTESSNYDGAPPVPPAYGIWRRLGPNEFEAKYEYYATAPAAAEDFMKGAGFPPSGRGAFVERITVSTDGQTFSSTIKYDAFDRKGEPIEGGGEATGNAVRIQF